MLKTSRFEFQKGSGRSLAEIAHKSSNAENSGDHLLSLEFEVTRHFDYDNKNCLISVLNCSGEADIAGVHFNDIICPRFFKVSSTLPKFLIPLSKKRIHNIEKNRNNKAVEIDLKLHVLYSMHDSAFYAEGCRQYVTEFSLYACIEKSNWLEELLPSWEVFQSKESIIEHENLGIYKGIQQHISKCRQLYIEARYDDVLTNGYKLLEAVPKILGFKDVKTMFETLGEHSEVYMKQKYIDLDKIYYGLKNLSNLTRHSKVSDSVIINDHIKKSDAKFYLHSIELLMDYILNDDHIQKPENK